MEFSKKIFIFVATLSVVITIGALIVMWHVEDISALSALITASFAELATATGFYYKKAEKENVEKIKGSGGENNVSK